MHYTTSSTMNSMKEIRKSPSSSVGRLWECVVMSSGIPPVRGPDHHCLQLSFCFVFLFVSFFFITRSSWNCHSQLQHNAPLSSSTLSNEFILSFVLSFSFDFSGGHCGAKSHSEEGHSSIFSHKFQILLGIPSQLRGIISPAGPRSAPQSLSSGMCLIHL